MVTAGINVATRAAHAIFAILVLKMDFAAVRIELAVMETVPTLRFKRFPVIVAIIMFAL